MKTKKELARMKHFIVLIFAAASAFAQQSAHGPRLAEAGKTGLATAPEPRVDRQPVPASPASSTDPRQ
jgi:hypothetical protein